MGHSWSLCRLSDESWSVQLAGKEEYLLPGYLELDQPQASEIEKMLNNLLSLQ